MALLTGNGPTGEIGEVIPSVPPMERVVRTPVDVLWIGKLRARIGVDLVRSCPSLGVDRVDVGEDGFDVSGRFLSH